MTDNLPHCCDTCQVDCYKSTCPTCSLCGTVTCERRGFPCHECGKVFCDAVLCKHEGCRKKKSETPLPTSKKPRLTFGRVKIVLGDCLLANEQYIGHQCNCKSVGVAGFAKKLFDAFPWANDYMHRQSTSGSDPGSISVHCVKTKQYIPGIVNMFAQIIPGRPRPSLKDGPRDRKLYFKSCLDRIANLDGINSIAFPYGIGCGLANGDWSAYLNMLDTWAENNPHLQVVIYKLPTGL